MTKRYSLAILAALIISSACFFQACQGPGNSQGDSSLSRDDKPQVDSSHVIDLQDLYRAKRYEDLQTALADGPEQVYKISFHGRQLGSLSPEIAHFPYLATLDVAYNGLTELPAELAGLHYLQGFYANGNKLTVFPDELLQLPLLARLNLSENQLTEIPKEIGIMDQLEYLNLEKNGIMRIPVQLYELDQMTALNLAENGLSTIPEGISRLSSLKKLDLSLNQLRLIPRELVSMGSHLEELQVHGNQISREDIDWLIESMPATKIRF